MELQGSCHCGQVVFVCKSHTPYPYMYCYCSICRKCQGGSGSAINIMAQRNSFKYVKGEDQVHGYRAAINRDKPDEDLILGGNTRYFCTNCGSMLYAYDPEWKEWIYPFASAIDTPLPKPPLTTHIKLNSKADWVYVPAKHAPRVIHFEDYPDASINDWHVAHKLRIE